MKKSLLVMMALAAAVLAAQPAALTPEQTLDRRGSASSSFLPMKRGWCSPSPSP
jgi:hypothetical protein